MRKTTKNSPVKRTYLQVAAYDPLDDDEPISIAGELPDSPEGMRLAREAIEHFYRITKTDCVAGVIRSVYPISASRRK